MYSLQRPKLNLYLASRPPKPSSTVPFRRDPDFVDRGDLLSRVDERCSQPAGRAALVGLGGVGKSQLAIEHTYRTRERSPDRWVFWVHSSNAARFEQSYRDIADVIKIAGREDPKADIFKLVHDWLRGCEGKWLMILDNVDDADFLVNAQPVIQSQSSDSGRQTLRPHRDYLPQSQNGSILITTRSRESALKLSERYDLISVDPMDASNAVELLDKKLESTGQKNDKDHIELAAALEFMPLAIVQAAAYISQRAPRCSVRQYLEDFRKSDGRKTSLLNHEGGQLRRDWEAKNSIIITWQISFEHIHRTWPSAADLLSLMSFFDRQGIPEPLVRGRARAGNGPGSRKERRRDDEKGNGNEDGSDGDGNGDRDSISEASNDDGFEEDVQILRDYSFISLETSRTFEMHALVQLATRRWLEAEGQCEQWKHHYIRNLAAAFPAGDYENWTTCRALFPHAKAAIAQRPRAEESLRVWASLLYNAANYAWRKGSVTEAIDMSRAALDVQKKILGQEHKKTLSSMGLVSLAYHSGGRWDEAEELEVQVMEIRKRVLGEEHPFTLISISNLASIYWSQGRWKKAQKLDVQIMEIRKRVLGEEHPSTLTSINNLASIRSKQGRWKEAEELDMRVIEIRKRVLGEEHPDTLISIINRASTYGKQGRWKEAEELGVQIMEITKRVLGEEHPDTLISMANLAYTLMTQTRYEEAISLMESCVESRKRILGLEHPATQSSLQALHRWRKRKELAGL